MRSTRYRLRAEDLAWRVLDGEGVLVDLVRQRIMICNAPATAVVAALLDEATEAELVEELRASYDVDEERVRTDVRGLLAELPVVPATDERSSDSPRLGSRPRRAAADGASARRAYVRPTVDASELFYAAAGCGKASPRITNCQRVKKNS